MVLFTHTNKLEIPKIADAETNPTKNHQDNGATSQLGTQPSSSHSSLTDTSVAPAKPPPIPHVEAGDVAVLGRGGDLPDVCLLGANVMIFGVYRNWVHKNPGNHLDGRIAEGEKWQTRWGKPICMTIHKVVPLELRRFLI